MSEKRFTVMKKFDGSYVICENGEMLVADDCCDLLNEADNRIESLEKRSKQLFLMEKVIDRMLSKEEQIGFYNMVELEMIRDE